MNRNLFSICAIVAPGADGVPEAHVVACMDPARKLPEIMRAVRAEMAGNRYDGSEYAAAWTWLPGVVRRGAEASIRIVTLARDIGSQSQTHAPKARYEEALRRLGFRLPVGDELGRRDEAEALRRTLAEAGIALPETASVAPPPAPEGVTLRFRRTGEVHAAGIRLVAGVLAALGYEIDHEVGGDGSASFWIVAPGDMQTHGPLSVEVEGFTSDTAVKLGSFDCRDSTPPRAHVLSELASLPALADWHAKALKAEVETALRALALEPTPRVAEGGDWFPLVTPEGAVLCSQPPSNAQFAAWARTVSFEEEGRIVARAA